MHVALDTLHLGGEERPFQVGTNQGEIFCRLKHRHGEDGQPLSLKAYGVLFSPAALQAEALTGGDLRDFVFSALAAGCQHTGLRVDFTPFDVGNWIDQAGPEEEAEIIKPLQAMLGQLLQRAERYAERAKNAPAPTQTAKGPKAGKATTAA